MQRKRSILDLVLISHIITRSAIWLELSDRGAVTRKVVQNIRPSFSHVQGGAGHETKAEIGIESKMRGITPPLYIGSLNCRISLPVIMD